MWVQLSQAKHLFHHEMVTLNSLKHYSWQIKMKNKKIYKYKAQKTLLVTHLTSKLDPLEVFSQCETTL